MYMYHGKISRFLNLPLPQLLRNAVSAGTEVQQIHLSRQSMTRDGQPHLSGGEEGTDDLEVSRDGQLAVSPCSDQVHGVRVLGLHREHVQS